MQHKPFKRLLSGILAVAVAVNGLVITTLADNNTPVEFTKVSNKNVSADFGRKPFELKEKDPGYNADDVVRVSIFLKDKSTIEAGFEVKDIADNIEAINYREGLQRKQDAVVTEIERVTKKDLDVVWNVTLAANLISANVEFGQIEKIEKIGDVQEVVIETQYQPDEVKKTLANDPNMATSSAQIGSSLAWAAGYTGAGSRIAIIDTGTDDSHQSFSEEGFLYSLGKLAENEGKTTDEFIKGLNLLTVDEIAGVVDQLNVEAEIDPAKVYLSQKLPFAFNYVDLDYDTDHSDGESEHGSHVAGIATANSYVKTENGFQSALAAVHTQGVAPDAQLITMKVFGKGGGAYDSDYMVAIEDAIILNADSINLSLGSGNPGMSRPSNAKYQAIMDNLVECGVVVSISAGNSGAWADNSLIGGIYSDDVALQTDGSPGSFNNALTVASIDNAGSTGLYLQVGDDVIIYSDSSATYGANTLDTLAGEQEYVFIDGVGTPEDWAAVGDALKGKIAVCSRGTTSFFEKANAAVEAGAIATIIYNNQPGTIGLNLTGYLYTYPCISITQAEGALLKKHATEVKAAPAAANVEAEETTAEAEETTAEDEEIDSAEIFEAANGDVNDETPFEAADEDVNDETPSETEDADSTETSEETSDEAENTDAEENAPAESGDDTAAPEEAAPAEEDTQADEAGSVYYVGTMTISEGIASVPSDVEYYTMSDFSSWGVPGTLTLKPEITAPGGNIYSVNGTVGRTEDYENMSGTSMAAPQIAGMAAVAAQYVRKNGLADKTGVNERTLIQSLLMSTAEPVLESEGVYYSVLKQGAGLANINNVINADSYILMGADATASYNDGKVKVELGEDADKKGEYTFSFTVNNLTASAKTYDLSAILFTQDIEVDEYGDEFLSKSTTSLASQAVFSGADVSGTTVTVAANGSAEVTVTLTLTDKDALEAYVNGAYIEGYVFVTPSGADADQRVEHSIPVFGFYGNWSDPSMFDVGSYEKYFLSGEEERLPYLLTVDADGNIEEDALYANIFLYTDTDDKTQYPFGGNPYDETEEYIPERNAINGKDAITVSYAAIRNAAASRFAAYGEDGSLLAFADGSNIECAYYYDSGAVWNNTSATFRAGNLSSVAEDTALTLAFEAALEYYVDEDGNVAWDKLGKGAALTMPAVVDNTAPVVLNVEVNKENNKLIVTVQDNQYVAAIALFDRTGSDLLAADFADLDADKGAKNVYEFDVSEVQGKKFLLQVFDYASNTTTYEIKHQIGEEVELPEMIAFNVWGTDIMETYLGFSLYDSNYWVGLNETTDSVDILGNPYEFSDIDFYAATIADHFVFACTEDGQLYVMPEDDLSDMTKICDMVFTLGGKNYIGALDDMAYNYVDSNIYATIDGIIFSVDKLTGELEIVGVLPFEACTLACDKEGNFYCNEIGTGDVYKFTLDSISDEGEFDAELVCEVEEFVTAYAPQAMEVDPNTGILWWTATDPDLYVPYVKIDTETGDYTVLDEDLFWVLSALVIPETGDTNYDFNDDGYVDERDAQALLDYRTGVISEIANEENADFDGNDVIDSRDAYLFLNKLWYAPTKDVTGIQIDAAEVELTVGYTQELSYILQPWTAADKSVTWTSSDESIATVDENGVITAVSAGECTITAVPNANDTLSATCKVTVNALEVTVDGILQDEEGKPMFFNWNMAQSKKWTSAGDFPTELISATKFDLAEMLFAVDWDGNLNVYNSDATEQIVQFEGFPFYDMEMSQLDYSLMGINGNKLYFFYLFDDGSLASLDLTRYDISNPVAVTSEGIQDIGVGGGVTVPGEIVAVLDSAGTISRFAFLIDGRFGTLMSFNSNINETFDGYQGLPFTSMVYNEDEGCYYVATMNHSENTSKIYRCEPFITGECETACIGNVGDGVWPAVLLSAAPNASAQPAANFFGNAPALTIAEAAKNIDLDSAVEISSDSFIADSEVEVVKNDVEAINQASEATKLDFSSIISNIGNISTFSSNTAGMFKGVYKTAPEFSINASDIKPVKANAADDIAPVAETDTDTVKASKAIKTEEVEVEDEGETFEVKFGAVNGDNEPVDTVNGVAVVTYDPEALEVVDVEIDADYTSVNILEEDGVIILGYVSAEDVITAETLFETITFAIKDLDEADGTLVNVDVTEYGDLTTHTNELIDLSSPLDGTAADAIDPDKAVKVVVFYMPVENPTTPPAGDDDDGKIVLEDKDTGVKVEIDNGGVDSSAELVVDETGRDDDSVSVDISVVVDGVEVQPSGEMVVTIPVPDGLEGDEYHVYRVEADGSLTDMNAVYANGVLTFTTDRLGEFVVSAVKLPADTNKPAESQPADTNKPAENDPVVNDPTDPTGTNAPDVSIDDNNNNNDDGNKPGSDGDKIPGTGVALVVAPAAISALAVLASKKHKK